MFLLRGDCIVSVFVFRIFEVSSHPRYDSRISTHARAARANDFFEFPFFPVRDATRRGLPLFTFRFARTFMGIQVGNSLPSSLVKPMFFSRRRRKGKRIKRAFGQAIYVRAETVNKNFLTQM